MSTIYNATGEPLTIRFAGDVDITFPVSGSKVTASMSWPESETIVLPQGDVAVRNFRCTWEISDLPAEDPGVVVVIPPDILGIVQATYPARTDVVAPGVDTRYDPVYQNGSLVAVRCLVK